MKRNTATRIVPAILGCLWIISAHAELSHVEIQSSELLGTNSNAVQYQAIYAVLHFVLDPTDENNQNIVDINLAPTNTADLVEFSTDFKLLLPRQGHISSALICHVNNHGGSRLRLQLPVVTDSVGTNPLSMDTGNIVSGDVRNFQDDILKIIADV